MFFIKSDKNNEFDGSGYLRKDMLRERRCDSTWAVTLGLQASSFRNRLTTLLLSPDMQQSGYAITGSHLPVSVL